MFSWIRLKTQHQDCFFFEMLQLTYYIYKWFLTGVLSVCSFHINYSRAPWYLYLKINVLMVLDKTMPFTIPSVHTAIMTRKISCTFTLLQVFPSYQVGSIACKIQHKENGCRFSLPSSTLNTTECFLFWKTAMFFFSVQTYHSCALHRKISCKSHILRHPWVHHGLEKKLSF